MESSLTLEMNSNSPTVIYDKDGRTYKKSEQERVDWLEAFFESDPCVQTNDGVST